MAVPFETPVTTPALLTTATAVLLLSHVTALFVAVEGRTEALRVYFWVLYISIASGSTVTPAARCVTVRSHDAV